jgi:phage N-6-adenine-methyltransferase
LRGVAVNSLITAVESAPVCQRDTQIVALCDRAIVDLREARTIEDVRSIGDIAAAFREYARKIKAAIEAQNATQTVVLLAEARIGAELKAAQERGELAGRGNPYGNNQHGGNARAAGISSSTLDSLGIPSQRASEMRQLADIGEVGIREAARVANDAGEPLTRSAVFNHRAQGTGENEWYTPAEYVEAARLVMGGIDLDPASSETANRTVKASRILTQEQNGLAVSWHGRVWLNPPYAQPWIAQFAEKMVEEFKSGRVRDAITLTHNYTDTQWFHALAGSAAAVCFTRGRIGFLSPDGKRAAPTQGQAFCYFGANVPQFAEEFARFGLVMVRYAV